MKSRESDNVKIEGPSDESVVEQASSSLPNRPRKVYGGMWGLLEIGAVVSGVLVLLAAMLTYLIFVIPSNRQLATNKSKASSLEAEIISARTKYGEITDTETRVNKVLASVDDFETRYLPAVSNGHNTLYQRLNGLILAYGLINTSGPDYTPLLTTDRKQNSQSDDGKGREKFRSLYPGVYVTMTVEGTYQNLRRFIRDIETGSEFIIISAIKLAPAENEGGTEQGQIEVTKQQTANVNNLQPNNFPPGIRPTSPPQMQNQPPRARGKMHGETISLHIEMAAYFRRANFTPLATTQQ